jgi:hypothetical protein
MIEIRCWQVQANKGGERSKLPNSNLADQRKKSKRIIEKQGGAHSAKIYVKGETRADGGSNRWR